MKRWTKRGLAGLAAVLKQPERFRGRVLGLVLCPTRELAEQHVQHALATLAGLPACTARDSLETVALASLERTS